MGLSRGLDSSYLLHLEYKLNLRILCVHIDDVFDTEKNIKRLSKATGIKVIKIKPNKEQYSALIKVYMYVYL